MTTASAKNGKRDGASIGLLWLATRALPLYWVFSQLERKFDFEVPQVKKLLEYGFWARKGALINPDFGFGLISNPGSYNYVNHPYPIFWLYALLYRIGGEVAIYLFLATVGLASCLLVQVVLRRYFSRSSAWFATALFTVAQGAIEFDVNTDVVAFGTVVWLLIMLVISRVHLDQRSFSKVELWALGLGVFVAGQISWFSLTVLPAVLIFSLPPEVRFGSAIRNPFRVGPWKALLFGGAATMMLFLLQVFCYSSGAHEDRSYVMEQLGLTGISRWGKLPFISVRMFLAGPALWFGAIVALVKLRGLLKTNRLFLGAAIYLPVFIVVCLILPGLLSRNQHAYRYNLFPCAILIGFALENIRRTGWLKLCQVGLAMVGLAACYAKVQVVNKASAAAYTLGKWLEQNSAPSDVILFNWKNPVPPVQSYDVEFGSRTGYAADRIVRIAVNDTKAMAGVTKRFSQSHVGFLFLRDAAQPLSEDLQQALGLQAELIARTNLLVPTEPAPVYKIARQRLYSWLNKSSPAQNEAQSKGDSNAFSLELYRLNSEAVNVLASTNQAAFNSRNPMENTR